MKRTSTIMNSARFGAQATRAYSSEMANALVQVSQNIGMGNAAIGLGGAGIGIGLVFAALLGAVARNPSLRGQLFSYAILGFAFVEAIGVSCYQNEMDTIGIHELMMTDTMPTIAFRPDGCHDVQVRLSEGSGYRIAAGQRCISIERTRVVEEVSRCSLASTLSPLVEPISVGVPLYILNRSFASTSHEGENFSFVEQLLLPTNTQCA
ncbi:uncharacterized protein K489DRAFT_240814 [Dissoconium aciculare CBS 342.82]|uniref:ATP synthase subunit 9, mitochondrial n=1 Tax=Dissoconium aciculare CBS 342.82 TaxID=1314786 RepID=A0A6J3M674_9PEZI|nr:uncharacterized protein K489DRAFT_240814 [Dissoconium aciculare CBS 342.82]KAF1822362.1 hypothetical protein K489DRAFT_240814 [Dissoconium aciculare CBS 342.82]